MQIDTTTERELYTVGASLDIAFKLDIVLNFDYNLTLDKNFTRNKVVTFLPLFQISKPVKPILWGYGTLWYNFKEIYSLIIKLFS